MSKLIVVLLISVVLQSICWQFYRISQTIKRSKPAPVIDDVRLEQMDPAQETNAEMV